MSEEKQATVNLDGIGLKLLAGRLGALEYHNMMLETAVAIYDHALEELIPDRETRAAYFARHTAEVAARLTDTTDDA